VIAFLASHGENEEDEGDEDSCADYYITNLGDNQVIIISAEFLAPDSPQTLDPCGAILKTRTTSLPIILKPSEVAGIKVFWDSKDMAQHGDINFVIGAISAKTDVFDLVTRFHESGRPSSTIFRPFGITRTKERNLRWKLKQLWRNPIDRLKPTPQTEQRNSA
jgi:hypothetical protein